MKNSQYSLRSLVGVFLFFVSIVLTGNGQVPAEAQALLPNQVLERSMTGAETHRYKFDLQANEFFQVRIEQKGVDVALKLLDADGKTLATMDSPNGKEGLETLSFVAKKVGSFILEITNADAKVKNANYTVVRETSRTATEHDKRRADLEQVFSEGVSKITSLFRELQKGSGVLDEGNVLAYKSKDDSLRAREKLNEALTIFRDLLKKVNDRTLLDSVKQASEISQTPLNSLRSLQFYVKSNEISCLNGIAQTHYNLSEWKEYIDYKNLALNGYREILADQSLSSSKPQFLVQIRLLEAQTLNLIAAGLHSYLGKSEEAISYLSQSIEHSRALHQETNDTRAKLLEAASLRQTAFIYGDESRSNVKAIEFFTKALEIYRKFPDKKANEASMSTAIASSHMLHLQYREAKENYEYALQIYRDIDYKFGQSLVLQMLGVLHGLLNNKREAGSYFSQNLSVLQSSDYAENYKKNFNNTGDNDHSEIWDELNDSFIEYERLSSIGSCYKWLEDYPKSLQFYEKSLAVARLRKDTRAIRQSLTDVGQALEKLERWNEASSFYSQALELSRKKGMREEIAKDLQDVGMAFREAGKTREALEYQNEALSIYQSIGVGENKIFSLNYSSLLNAVSRSHYDLKNREVAIFYGKRAVNAMQGERQRLQNLDLISQRGFLERKEKHYRRLADWLMEEGRLIEAEQVLRMLKEDEVSDYLRGGKPSPERLALRVDYTAEEKKAIGSFEENTRAVSAIGVEFSKLEELKKRGTGLTSEQGKRFDELKAQLTEANARFQRFLDQLAEEFKKGKDHPGEINEREGLQSDMKEWGGQLAYIYSLVGVDRYRTILITPEARIPGEKEIKAVELDKKILEFREQVKNPKIDPRPLGKELYDILVKPIEKELDAAGAKTLLWSLDGNLRLLPLAALWDGKEYFGQKYQNVVVTLASYTRIGRDVSPGLRVLGLGVSDARSVQDPLGGRNFQFGSLPAVPFELASIVRTMESPKGVLPGESLLNGEFTKKALEEQLGKGYKVVHIASHFSMNAGDATRSFLLLGDGTALTVNEIHNNKSLSFTGVELLTLSACDTAVAERDSTGKEMDGFAYVAQRKGAKAILATLWPVTDESTSLLMSEFYRLRKANPKLTKAEAMQLAQKAMIDGKLKSGNAGNVKGAKPVGIADNKLNGPAFPFDETKPFAHPYYWSPFILIGNWK